MAKKFDATEFNRRLSKLPASVRRNDSAAVEKNAAEWVALAKTLAPQDKGALVRSIRHEATPTGGQIIQAGGEATTREVRSGTGVEIDYAAQQEFGNEKMQPSPFFWPAYRLLKRKFANRRRRAMSKAFKEI